jgi:fused signal recognition particle receptor
MFEKFKRNKKPADDGQEAAETTNNKVVETDLNATEGHDNSSKTAIDAPVKNTRKAGIPASADAVFFKDTADQTSASVDEKKSIFSRLATGLSKTRSGFSDGVAHLLLGKKEIDDDLLEDLETQLVMADVGVEATREIMAKLTERVGRKELTDSDALFEALIKELQDILAPCEQPLVIDTGGNKPYVILMVGINGVGKTTTIGKLAKQFQAKGKSVMLAAGDTFRAAAVEQLQVWGDRNDVPVIAQHTGADSASVLYDALEAATARGTDILIADTAGRLHTKDNLMGELEKVVRVMKKIDPEAPHEVMLVLDAGTGQNAINQAVHFQKSVGVTGLTLTKLDGTAKGGVIFALAKQLALPVRFIGIGEGINDLRPFDANDFTRALFDKDSL